MPTQVYRTMRSKTGMYRTVFAGLVCAAVALCPSLSEAQAPAKPKIPEPVDKTLSTKDGKEIRITYYGATAGKESPVVMLLHGKGGSRLIYNNAPQRAPISLAKLLQQQGYAVVTVDLRGHGESSGGPGSAAGKKTDPQELKGPDFRAMVGGDLEAVKGFLYDENQAQKLNMNKLAIVAADLMTPVAVAYTIEDWSKTPHDDAPVLMDRTPRGQDVKCLVLLSPENDTPSLSLTAGGLKLRALGLPVMMAVGTKDSTSMSAANKLFDQLVPKKQDTETVFLQKYDGKFRGTDLLYKPMNPPVEAHMVNFLEKSLKSLPGSWRDRRSRLNRD